MNILNSISEWWDNNKDVVVTAVATVLVCAVADRASRTEAGRTALNGALVAGGTALAKNISKKFEEIEVNDEQIVIDREEYELDKRELELSRRREKLRKEEESLKSASKFTNGTSVTDTDIDVYVKMFRKGGKHV